MNQRWSEIDLSQGAQVQPVAFNAAHRSNVGEGETFLFVHGGVSVAYIQGISTSLRIGNKVNDKSFCAPLAGEKGEGAFAGSESVPRIPE